MKINEFAPDEGGGSRKFIPWPEFIDAVKQIVGKEFDVVEKVVKSTIQARFVPFDAMAYGPTMLYSYYEARAGRGKGAVSTRGAIQVGKYYPNSTALGTRNYITSFNLLKGHPFERHFDLTFDNIYKIANIIMGNTEGAYKVQPQQGVAEGKRKGVSFRDPELIKTQQFVKTHYPTYGSDPEVAFNKWTQRALKHSEEQDEKHNEILQQLSDKIAELEAEIGKVKHSDTQLDELSFMGSPCTKDCSGHRAGYEWSKRKGRVHAASWSPSFNNGAAIAVSGK